MKQHKIDLGSDNGDHQIAVHFTDDDGDHVVYLEFRERYQSKSGKHVIHCIDAVHRKESANIPHQTQLWDHENNCASRIHAEKNVSMTCIIIDENFK